eukprot:s1228_g13.t1
MTRRKGKPGKVDEPALPPLPPLPSKGAKAEEPPMPPLPPLPSNGDKAEEFPELPPLPPLPSNGNKAGSSFVPPPLPPLPSMAEAEDGSDLDGGSTFLPPPLPEIGEGGVSPGTPALPPLPQNFAEAFQTRRRAPVSDPPPDFTAFQTRRRAPVSDPPPDFTDYPDRDKTVDYVSVRLQSPAEIRASARTEGETKEQINGEVTLPYDFFASTDPDEEVQAVPEGLYSEQIFGKQTSYQRRKKTGYIELAWPCAHVWFSGTGKLGRAARSLGQKPSSILAVRQFQKDMFLGEWTAPRLWPLPEDPITHGPRVPAVGSPVAASEAPKLRKMSLVRATSTEEQDLEPDSSNGHEDPMIASREEHVIALLLKAACDDLPKEAAELSRTTRKVLQVVQRPEYAEVPEEVVARAIRLGSNLPKLARELEVMLETSRGELESPEQSRERAREARSKLIGFAAVFLQEVQGLTEEQANELLAIGLSDAEPVDTACRPFRRLAREDFYGFWKALALPGFSGDLDEYLQRIQADLHQVQASDAARALEISKKLINRALAALDLAIRAFEPQHPTSESPSAARGRASSSRYGPKIKEVQWYDPAITHAAFHLEDVERLSESNLANPGHRHEAPRPGERPPSHETPMEDSSKMSSAKASPKKAAGRLTRPQRGKLGSGARFYRRGQDANPRWHLPLQDATRPGCAGGQRLLKIGEVIPPEPLFWAEYAATRPRPTMMPAPIPSNMEAEGTLYVGTGAAVVRQALCQLEPVTVLQRLLWEIDLIDSIAKSQGPSTATRMNLHLASVTVPNKSVSARMSSMLKDLRERRNMMETASARHQLPEWMMFTSLPVLPPDLRIRSNTIEDIDEFPDDMNTMYKDILSAGRLFQTALAERAPAGLLRYRKFMLQMAVDCLIDNGEGTKTWGTGRINPAKTKTSGDPLESVAKRLKGKQGRMRKNLLGKRVDYSARTVIVVEPKLKLDECGLPFEIAKEIYMPFLLHEIREIRCEYPGDQSNFHDMMWFDCQSEEKQYELLEQAMGDRKIILNRAPTLHRLSMQAFQPILIPGKALKIHPLVCSPFNADFDGDTMTIHLILSKEAQEEAEELMMPSRNLSSPAHGDPVIGPTQDMVLGLYYMSSVTGPLEGPPKVIGSVPELEELTAKCSAGEVSHLQEVHIPRAILQQIAPEDENVADGPNRDDPVRTTAGRLQFFMMLHTGKVHPMRSNSELLDLLDAAPLVEP